MLGWSMWRARGAEAVTALCNESTKIFPDGVTRGIDLDDEAAVLRLFAEQQPSLIIQLRRRLRPRRVREVPEFAHLVNVDGTRFLVEHAPASARIVYCSSDHVFGGDGGP